MKTDPYPKELAKLARVTDIVRFAYPDAFAGIPERDREFYFSRGTAAHRLWQDVEEGRDQDYDYDPEAEKYRAGHAKFLRETGFRALPGGIEMLVVNEALGYKGTLDRIGPVGQRIWLLDYKATCVRPKPAALQTALYLLAIPGYKFREVERYGVGIKNDGSYSMSRRFPDADENEAIYWAQEFRKSKEAA